jgi:DNA-binding ferritin-like protein (Dps family)
MFLTRMIEEKRQYKRFRARVRALPQNYRTTVEALEHYVYYFASARSTNLLPLLDNLVEIFEEAAANDMPIRSIVGEDPVDFVEQLILNYPPGEWIRKERTRLTRAIDDATRSAGPGSDPR